MEAGAIVPHEREHGLVRRDRIAASGERQLDQAVGSVVFHVGPHQIARHRIGLDGLEILECRFDLPLKDGVAGLGQFGRLIAEYHAHDFVHLEFTR